ncbi:DUF222 domain-containing protein [Acidimicrobiaceae bacterium AH-315-P05]|nr:DUF222 domain-containing protein [Acidimicrobiaceae bacterium AH-315-P05]
MLLGLPAIHDLHPQAQADAHNSPAPTQAPFESDAVSTNAPTATNKQPTGATQSGGSGPDTSHSGGICPRCRTSGPPLHAHPTEASDGPGSRNRGRPLADINTVIGLSDLNALDDRQAVGYTSDGVPIPATTVRTLLCDAEIAFWVEQADTRQLTLVRTVRYATPIQRQALLVRDGGCVWKHCTMPASACEAHHITFWEHGGNTDLEHLCLLCPAHHRKLHAMGAHIKPGQKQRQWYLTRDSDGQTIKTWTNQPHRQKPGTNTTPKPSVA